MDVQACMASSSQGLLNDCQTFPVFRDSVTNSPRTMIEVLVYRRLSLCPRVHSGLEELWWTLVTHALGCIPSMGQHEALLGHVTDKETLSLPSARDARQQVQIQQKLGRCRPKCEGTGLSWGLASSVLAPLLLFIFPISVCQILTA